jgi:hypothetical protein
MVVMAIMASKGNNGSNPVCRVYFSKVLIFNVIINSITFLRADAFPVTR